MDVARQEGIAVPSIALHEPTLDMFIKYTGREIRAQEAASGFAGSMAQGDDSDAKRTNGFFG